MGEEPTQAHPDRVKLAREGVEAVPPAQIVRVRAGHEQPLKGQQHALEEYAEHLLFFGERELKVLQFHRIDRVGTHERQYLQGGSKPRGGVR